MFTIAMILLAVQCQPEDTLWTEAGEGWEIEVHYPPAGLEYEELGKILQEYARGQAEDFRNQFQEYYLDDPFLHDWVLEINFTQEPSPRGMICVLAWMWSYTGGAHGNSFTGAFNYSISEKRVIDTVELLGGMERFQSFANYVIGSLQSDDYYDPGWVERGASADPGNYHSVVPVPGDDCGIDGYTVFFPPYQVDCYATGTVEVFVPADWE